MKSILAWWLMVFGAFTLVSGWLTHQIDAEFTRPALIAGLVGGGLCVVWGVLGLLSTHGRGWAIFTLIALSFALLSQTVVNWMEHEAERPGGLLTPVLITLMFCASVGMVSWLAHAATEKGNLPDGAAAG